MELYLLKSSACLAIFFVFYKVFLEKENMHVFKRFYLLGMLVTSFGIPLIKFTSYIDASDLITSPLVTNTSEELYSNTHFIIENIASILWIIYSLGVFIFSIRFAKNLRAILLKIKRNQKLKLKSYINVLLFDSVTPHTFFSYIFLNKQKFEAQEIPEEVLIHEQSHAQQKHSIDIIVIEILQILFWFNPFIYLIKNAIKLNHEFLADKAVLINGVTTATYQDILLAFSSNALENNLANAINYSLIKKRFTVMKTHTSKRKIWLRSIFLLPLLALLIFGFSSKIEKEKDPSTFNEMTIQKEATKEQIKEYNVLAKKYHAMSKSNMRIKSSEFSRIQYLYDLMTTKQRKNAEPFPNFPPPPPPPAPINDKAPKAIEAPVAPRVIKGVNNVNSDIPPPPAPEMKEMKLKEKENKKRNQEKVALRSIEELNNKKEERELKRIALIDKREEDRYKMRKLEHEKVSLERIEERNEIQLKRMEERKKENDKRKVIIEEQKIKQNKRKIEVDKKVKMKDERIKKKENFL